MNAVRVDWADKMRGEENYGNWQQGIDSQIFLHKVEETFPLVFRYILFERLMFGVQILRFLSTP
jgi:hypothetical protein